MTLIMGAKCSDGVILVGDRKVTSTQGATTTPSFTDKIRTCGRFNWAIIGAAGVGTLFEEYLVLLPEKIDKHSNWIQYQNQRLQNQHAQEFKNNPHAPKLPPPMVYTAEEFKQDCVELLTEMRNRYNIAFQNPICRLDVLIGFAVQNEGSKLYYLNSIFCLPVEVSGTLLSIGQGELAEIFRKIWEPTMTMEQTAKLGMLAIKYIEQQGISDGIGVDTQQPQVWFIPNGESPKEIVGKELTAMVSNVDLEVAALRTKMNSLFRP